MDAMGFPIPAANAAGYDEGAQYLGALDLTNNAAGYATFATTVAATVPPGWIVTATATNPDGNTSEFDVQQISSLMPPSAPSCRARGTSMTMASPTALPRIPHGCTPHPATKPLP
jgi:hypothetical protein